MKLDKSPKTIKTMFNIISEEYDFMNNIISFKTQYLIKHKSLMNINWSNGMKVIDLCCGTGDMASIIKEINPNTQIIGIDFSEKMIEIAKKKNQNNGIQFFEGDITNLPYSDNTFDAAIMSFALRNISNSEKAIEETYRILKPNGQFLHIDFGEKNFLSSIFDNFTILSSKIFSKNKSAYTYLINSKKLFLTPNELIKDFESKGFKKKERRDYLFGVISAQIMTK